MLNLPIQPEAMNQETKEKPLTKEIEKLTILVEEVERASELLPETKWSDLIKEVNTKHRANSEAPVSMVSMGAHPFLKGMHRAYAEHRPFVLSPDMIWLLICQGVARHVNANSEALRDKLVSFSDKMVIQTAAKSDGHGIDWSGVIDDFSAAVNEQTKGGLASTLKAEFSTTGEVEKVVNQITILETFKTFFTYVTFIGICGIPEVTLEGQREDWELIITKTKALRPYQLDWWVDALLPVLEQIADTYRKGIDQSFWQSMFKIHTKDVYGSPEMVDGWILKFFPYDATGERVSINELNVEYLDSMAAETVSVPFKLELRDSDATVIESRDMCFVGGFVGLSQDDSSLALRPEIAWIVAEEEKEQREIKDEQYTRVMYRNMDFFPPEILKVPSLAGVYFHIRTPFEIPEAIKEVEIESFDLSGKVPDEMPDRIHALLPKARISVDGTRLFTPEEDWSL